MIADTVLVDVQRAYLRLLEQHEALKLDNARLRAQLAYVERSAVGPLTCPNCGKSGGLWRDDEGALHHNCEEVRS